jgi:hypothetical protein
MTLGVKLTVFETDINSSFRSVLVRYSRIAVLGYNGAAIRRGWLLHARLGLNAHHLGVRPAKDAVGHPPPRPSQSFVEKGGQP